MAQWVADNYAWIKAFHIIAVIAWMAGMLYLPRLFVYHCDAGPQASEMLKVMERRLLRAIINPAMIATLVFGGMMLAAGGLDWSAWWILAKLALVAGLVVLHGLLAKWRRDFQSDTNRRPAGFYRVVNEIPTALLIAIVILAVVKPG